MRVYMRQNGTYREETRDRINPIDPRRMFRAKIFLRTNMTSTATTSAPSSVSESSLSDVNPMDEQLMPPTNQELLAFEFLCECDPYHLRSTAELFREVMSSLPNLEHANVPRKQFYTLYWKLMTKNELSFPEWLTEKFVTERTHKACKSLGARRKLEKLSLSSKQVFTSFMKCVHVLKLVDAATSIPIGHKLSESQVESLEALINKCIGEFTNSFGAVYLPANFRLIIDKMSRHTWRSCSLLATRFFGDEDKDQAYLLINQLCHAMTRYFGYILDGRPTRPVDVVQQSAQGIDLGSIGPSAFEEMFETSSESSAPANMDGPNGSSSTRVHFHDPSTFRLPDLLDSEFSTVTSGSEPDEWVDDMLPIPGSFEPLSVEALQQAEFYPGISKMFQKIKETFQTGVNKVQSTSELVDRALLSVATCAEPGGTIDNGLTLAMQAIIQGADSIKHAMETVQTSMPTASNLFDAFMKYVLPIIAVVSGFFMNKHETLKSIFGITSVGLLVYWGPTIYTSISKLFGVRNHSSPSEVMKDILTVLQPIMGFTAIDESSGIIADMKQCFLTSSPVLSDLGAIEFILRKVTECWEALKRLVGWAHPDYKNFASGFRDVDEFVADALPIIECKSLTPTTANIEKVKMLYNLLAQLKVKHDKQNGIMRILSDFSTPLAKIHKEFSQLEVKHNGLKPVPPSLMLFGDPGLGKSTAYNVLVTRLIRYLLEDDPAMMEAYERSRGEFVYERRDSPYWEGAKPTNRIVGYPDFGSTIQNENSSTKHEAEHIQLVSNEPYTPNMAFDLKGKLTISPDFVISTTNNTKVVGDTVVHKLAFARRQIIVRQVWNGEGLKPLLGAHLNENDWGFELHTFDSTFAYVRDDSVPVMNIDQLFTMLVVCHKLARDEFERNSNFLKSDTASFETAKRVVQNMRVVPGKAPWEYVFNHAKFSLSLARTVVDKPLASHSLLTGWSSGAYEEVCMKESTFLTEEQFLGGVVDEAAVEAFNASAGTPCIDVALGGVIPRENFQIQDHNVLYIRRIFSKDPVALGSFITHPNMKEDQRLRLMCLLVKPLYRVAGISEVTVTPLLFFQLYERNPLLCLYSLCNLADLEAAKIVIAPTWGDHAKEAGKKFLQFLKENMTEPAIVAAQVIFVAGSVLATGIAAIKLWMPTAQPKRVVQNTSQHQQASAYLDMRQLKMKTSKRKQRKIKFELKEVQNHSSEVILTGIAMAMKAQWQLRDDTGDVVTNVLALGGRDFLFNTHTHDTIKRACADIDATKVYLSMQQGSTKVQIPCAELLTGIPLTDFDTYWVKLPSMPECREISPHWVSDKFIANLVHDSNTFFAMGSCIFGKGPQTSRCTLIGGRTVEDVYRSQLFSCQIMNSNVGDCGSACYIVSNGADQGKICGILQSGENGVGLTYFCAIPRRVMLEMRKKLSGFEAKPRPDNKKMLIGESDTPHDFSTQVRDILVPSEHPAKENEQDVVRVNDPEVYNKARAKYCPGFIPEKDDLDKLRICIREVLRDFKEKQNQAIKPGTLSLQTAILGEDASYIRGIPLNTSPGAPFNAKYNLSKHQLCGDYQEGQFIPGSHSDVLINRVGDYLEHLLVGEVPIDCFTDIVKSETLPIKKIEAGKGRIVSACGIVRTICSRILFGRFWEWIFANHLSNGISAGDNMLGEDANLIVREHLAVACGEDTHFAGDLSANDARQTAEVLTMAMEEIVNFMKANDCMTETHERMARTFAKSYNKQYHIRGALVDLWEGSLGSGDPNTTGLNSITNPGYARFSVWRATGFKENFHDEYNAKIKSNYMGDDNWHSAHPTMKSVISEKVMADGYARFGHVYTNDQKDGINLEFKKIEDTCYLKRSPRYEPALGKWLMCLDLSTVLEIPLWTKAVGKEFVPNMDQALENCDTMVRELCFHPEEAWQEWIPKYKKMFSEYRWSPKFDDRLDMLRHVLGAQKIEFFNM